MTASKKKTKRGEMVKKTEFSLSAPQAQRVSIAGDFNQWNRSSQPLQQDTKGTWRISLDLKPAKYEYRFLLDGEWQNDPNCDSFVENPFGTSNCLKIVE
jgi:1,4-alpha-glucan branching enzyme